MSKTKTQSEKDTLEEIAERIKSIESFIKNNREGRIDLSKGRAKKDALLYIKENEPCGSAEVQENIQASDATSTLADLYHAHYVNRHGQGPMEYTLSEIGRRELQLNDSDAEQQQTMDDIPRSPWETGDLNRGEYITLRLVSKHSGHPMAKDLKDDYAAEGYSDDATSVAARLVKLYNSGYVDRPSEKPYRYWLTDKGRDELGE